MYGSYQNINIKIGEKLILDTHSDLEAYLVISVHATDAVLLCAILNGNAYHGNKLTPILPTSVGIKVTQGTRTSPLIIESIYYSLKLYFVPLGFFGKTVKLEMEIQKS